MFVRTALALSMLPVSFASMMSTRVPCRAPRFDSLKLLGAVAEAEPIRFHARASVVARPFPCARSRPSLNPCLRKSLLADSRNHSRSLHAGTATVTAAAPGAGGGEVSAAAESAAGPSEPAPAAAAAASATAAASVGRSGGMAQTALQEMSADGAFKRTSSVFRHQITADGSSGFPAVAGRYHLYISYACPWASRCFMFLKLKGLEHAIGVTAVEPKWQRTREGEEHFGWPFAADSDNPVTPGAEADPINGARFIRDLYEMADPSAKKFSVPVLWDKERKTIVNNESADITRMLNTEFNALARHADLDLYPAAMRAEIDAVNEWVYPSINNGVYRCGFATKQAPYEEAFLELFSALDRCEGILSQQRYLAGEQLTEADVRLFVTLIRFDEVYVVHFKCNKKFIREYPNLFNYTKEIFQLPGVAETVSMRHIKEHYYGSHPSINPHGVVPLGFPIDFSSPHDRNRLPGKPLY